MLATVTLRELTSDEARAATTDAAALVDLRPVDDYLSGHVRSSLSLAYEQGPGFASRARDCLPLHLPLILIDDSAGDRVHAAASLRGKGYEVMGFVPRAALKSEWEYATCDVSRGKEPPSGFILDVNDPGAFTPEGAERIPIDQVWNRVKDIDSRDVCVVAGRGVRAALAVGILEGAGVSRVSFWFSRG